MKRIFSILSFVVAASLSLWAQTTPQIQLNATTNGQTVYMTNQGCQLYDDGTRTNNGVGGYYACCYDYVITLVDTLCQGNDMFSLTFDVFDVGSFDTLYIYDGPSINSPLLYAANNSYNNLLNRKVFASLLNQSHSLTIRFVTHQEAGGQGFIISAGCQFPCETVIPHIKDKFLRMKDGVLVDTGYVKNVLAIDTTILIQDNAVTGLKDTIVRLDSNYFRGVNMCQGEELVLFAYGEYSHNYGLYDPNDYTTEFRWNFGNGDTLYQTGATEVRPLYRDPDCYDVTLVLIDERECYSVLSETVRIRMAQNPIKTIYDLATICNVDSLLVTVGYEGDNGTITLKQIKTEKLKSKTYAVRTFIPDGPNCPVRCFSAPVTFNDFPSGRNVTSKEDICSVCVNYEHEFMGDYTMSVVCPTGAKAVLKYYRVPAGSGAPDWVAMGSGTFTGYPYAGESHHSFESTSGSGHVCDSLYNYFGVGLDYCFSRNSSYTLVSGDKANVVDYPMTNPATSVGDRYIAYSQAPKDAITYTFAPIPAPFQPGAGGSNPGQKSFQTRHPSDHENKLDYYLPVADFSELIGCPLNGQWSIEICDEWGSDNGWIFSWSLDICGISSGNGCQYQVGLDSIVWLPDSSYADYSTGRYRGLNINARDSINSYILSRDTAGTFPIFVKIYDEFGCVWDTTTKITTVWTPEPNLGADRLICDVEYDVINAADRHSATSNYTYMWEPFGQNTDTIHSRVNLGSSTLYTVEVTNTESGIRCRSRDSVRVNINQMPAPNFDPGIYPLEGCEPFTINFNNTSVGGHHYTWVFGDGDSSNAESPVHSYSTGQYDLKYYIYSEFGCTDSLIFPQLITVYSSPVAKFSWEPVNPTVLHPEVNFINMTVPQSPDNKYYWEIQYDRDNHISYHTLTDVNPTFEWYTNGEDISGSYVARLIAKTSNLGPSGNIIECRDTIENTILLVNDFLQFPNVITPNGDGYNDKFVIVNLVNGMGYPNNSLAIYDRWGKRVYYKENISSEDDFWDPGKDNIPAGTYFWRFVGKGYLGDIQRNGVVEVLK